MITVMHAISRLRIFFEFGRMSARLEADLMDILRRRYAPDHNSDICDLELLVCDEFYGIERKISKQKGSISPEETCDVCSFQC